MRNGDSLKFENSGYLFLKWLAFRNFVERMFWPAAESKQHRKLPEASIDKDWSWEAPSSSLSFSIENWKHVLSDQAVTKSWDSNPWILGFQSVATMKFQFRMYLCYLQNYPIYQRSNQLFPNICLMPNFVDKCYKTFGLFRDVCLLWSWKYLFLEWFPQ